MTPIVHVKNIHVKHLSNRVTFFSIVDGGWTLWTDWSDCSSTCGPGLITRDRTCTNPLPQYGGQGCFGSPQEGYACNGTCTVHGAWGGWQTWSQCTKTCDSGLRGRARICDSPAPTPDGRKCMGNSFEMEDCNTQSCSGGGSSGNGTGSGSGNGRNEAQYVNVSWIIVYICNVHAQCSTLESISMYSFK